MSYFNKALRALFSQPWLPIPDDKNVFLLLGTGRASFIGELYLLFSGRKGGDQNILLTSVVFQVPLVQNNPHAQLACCGWQVLQLSQAQIFLWPIVSSTVLGTQVLAHRGFGSSLSERNFYIHYNIHVWGTLPWEAKKSQTWVLVWEWHSALNFKGVKGDLWVQIPCLCRSECVAEVPWAGSDNERSHCMQKDVRIC